MARVGAPGTEMLAMWSFAILGAGAFGCVAGGLLSVRWGSASVAYPGLIRLVHQANSGGPAVPNNRALDRATGRYVFFVGADDYIGPDAMRQIEPYVHQVRVERRAARYVEQLRLDLRRDHPDVPRGSRFFFADVPQGVGVGHAWFTPAVKVWYRDLADLKQAIKYARRAG